MSNDYNYFVSEIPEPAPPAGFAEVAEVLADGIRLLLDGEDEPGEKPYKKLDSYASPKEGDRVFFYRISGTLLVVGKVD